MASKDVQYPNPWNLCICYLTWQRNFLDTIKLRTLTWGNYPV